MYINLRTDGVASVGAGYTTVERIGMRDGGGFVARETSAYIRKQPKRHACVTTSEDTAVIFYFSLFREVKQSGHAYLHVVATYTTWVKFRLNHSA
jgi:hypothetical protein